MSTIPNFTEYCYDIAPLSTADGGGFVITWPDLPGCMSDGQTIESTIINGQDAFQMWMETHIEQHRAIPKPAYGLKNQRVG